MKYFPYATVYEKRISWEEEVKHPGLAHIAMLDGQHENTQF